MGGTVRSAHEVKKKHDGRTSITVLMLGDEGVGKSSLISTFVSRHFSEIVPGIMTRVRLPPDPHSSCVTTIVDSQGGDAALLSAVAAMSLSSPSGSSTSLTSLSRTENLSRMGNLETIESGGQSALAASGYSSAGGGGMGSSGSSVSAGIDHVDSIVLVYDLDRVETFYRLENHWLPLIERCYNGELPVIIAGNKMDLFRQSSSAGTTDEHSLARSRQEIVSLLQRFKFVRQCIKCSAKNLLHVDEVFLKAQQAVLYPINPLYDLTSGRLAPNCRRAFTRIFRMYDRDNDGLLSNVELNSFQNQTFHVPLVERDLAGWKKVVSRNNPTEEAVVKDGKFTVAGFMAIFDVFISQNRLEVPWRVLRNFGYDDALNLHIPSSVTSRPSGDDRGGKNWKLSSSARKFLAAVFHQFDSDHDGVLSAEDILSIFSIAPEPSLPPWHPMRAPDVFNGCFSLPKVVSEASESDTPSSLSPQPGQSSATPASSPSLSASGITIGSTTTLPSITSDPMRQISRPLSFLEWMGHWHMISSISPASTRAELYRLGHIEDESTRNMAEVSGRKRGGQRKAVSPIEADYSSVLLPSLEVRVLVVGSKGCGKTALLNSLCSVGEGVLPFETSPLRTKPTVRPETMCSYVRLKRKAVVKGGTGVGKVEDIGEDLIVHLVLTELPEADVLKRKEEVSAVIGQGSGSKRDGCDLVLLAFDCADETSLAYAKEVEKSLLTDEVPRVFVGTKTDMINTDGEDDHTTDSDDVERSGLTSVTVLEAAQHCAELDLEPPLVTSASKTKLGGDDERAARERSTVLQHLSRCAFDDDQSDQLRAKPHAERKRREAARRRKMMWLGGLAVTVSVAVAVGVGVLWGGGKNGERKDRLGWLKNWLIGVGGGTSTSAAKSE